MLEVVDIPVGCPHIHVVPYFGYSLDAHEVQLVHLHLIPMPRLVHGVCFVSLDGGAHYALELYLVQLIPFDPIDHDFGLLCL